MTVIYGFALLFAGGLLAQESFENLFEEGLRLAERGEDLAALQSFRAAARIRPEHAYVFYNIGSLLERQGRPAEALAAFETAADLAPGERPIQLAWGEALFRSGERERSRLALERAAAPPDPIPEALPLLAAIEEAEGDREGAWSLLRDYLELRPGDVATRILLGEQLAANRRYAEAIEVWKGGLDPVEPSAELLFRIGEAARRSPGGYREAESHLRRALEEDPLHLEARLLLGRILSSEGRLEEGLEEIERAVRDHPDAASGRFALAQAYQQLGREEEARAARSRFESLSREAEARAHRQARFQVAYKEARELLDRGRLLEAEEAFRSALAIDPTASAPLSMLAKIAFSRGDVEEARSWIGRALSLEPAHGEYLYLDALFARTAGDGSRAEGAARKAVAAAPGFTDAWVLLGSILIDADRASEALSCLRTAEALEPDNPAIQLNLATAYHRLGDRGEEARAMERYRELTERSEVRP